MINIGIKKHTVVCILLCRDDDIFQEDRDFSEVFFIYNVESDIDNPLTLLYIKYVEWLQET